jgi:carboxymethylenebutenolidase
MSSEVAASNFPVYVSGDTEHPFALVVLQEAFGVNAHIRKVCDEFGQDGFFVVAPHLFHRNESPEIPYDDFPAAMAEVGALTADGLRNDLIATMSFLKGLGYQKQNIGVVGYCMGGSVAFFANTLDTVGASVSYYGGGVETGRFGLPSLIELASSLKAPWLGNYGDQDQGIPVEQLDALSDALATSAYETDLIIYEGGQHGFNCDGRPAVYNEELATLAREKTLEFFRSHLEKK